MGKKSNDAPDYTPLANASAAANEKMTALGQQQLDFAKKQYNENNPMMQEIAKKQGLAMDQQLTQGKDYYDYLKDTYRPVEKGIVADAMAFDTDAYRNQLATRAAADSGIAFNRTRQANERAMASMGVNPNSGRFQGMAGQAGLMQAAGRAGAMTGARERAQQTGYARKLDAAGLGRGLSGASTAAYGSALGAGNSAVGNYGQAGQQYMQGMGQGSATIGSGLNMQLSGLGNVLNAQASYAANAPDQSFLGNVGGILGGAAGMAEAFPTFGAGLGKLGTAFIGSDIRLKENIEPAGVDAVTGLNLYDFNYKWNPKRFRGVMAQEVKEKYPEAVYTSGAGWMAVYYDMLGIEMKEVH
jgi:hypothetical protein